LLSFLDKHFTNTEVIDREDSPCIKDGNKKLKQELFTLSEQPSKTVRDL